MMKIEKVEFSGLLVLFVGVGLLAFTFFSAYSFLMGILNISGSQNLVGVFGEALAPLIEAIIRILYLGVMGWIGSILTIRAVQLLKKERTEIASTQTPIARVESKQTPSKQETGKPEPKPEVKETKTDAEKPSALEKPSTVKAPEKVENPPQPQNVEKPKEQTQAPQAPPSTTPPPTPAS